MDHNCTDPLRKENPKPMQPQGCPTGGGTKPPHFPPHCGCPAE